MNALTEQTTQESLTIFVNRLAQQIKGQANIQTKAGVIHILTKNCIVQVAYPQDWLRAFGEAIAFGHYYPGRSKVIYLLTGLDDEKIPMIQEHCKQSGITLWFGLI